MSNKLSLKPETTTQPTHFNVVVGGALKRLTWAGFVALLNAGWAGLTHASRHKSGGADPIKLDELAAPTDVTTLDATTSVHGLMSKLDKIKLTAIASGADVTAAAIQAASAKTTPAAADKIAIIDTESGNTLAVVTFANLKAAVTAAIVAGAPSTLDTLDELAAALNDDANLAATITTALAGKVPVTRAVTGAGLATGGGALSADRVITVTASTQEQAEAGEDETTAMTPLRVKQAIIALSGIGDDPVPTLYVDNVRGNDRYDGRSSRAPVKTFAAAVALAGANEVIGLARGCFWRETLDLTALTAPTVVAYGEGDPPRITGMDHVQGVDWANEGGSYPAVYSTTVTHGGGGRLRVFSLTPVPPPGEPLLEQLVGVADLATCQATPGSFVRPVYTSPATIYIHPADGVAPASSSVQYQVTVRTNCIVGPDNCTVRGIETGESLTNNGPTDLVSRENSVIEQVIGSNGSKHNIGGGNGRMSDCFAFGADATTDEEPSNAAFVAFRDNPTGETAIFERCGVTAHGVGINNDTIAHGNPNPFDYVTTEQCWVVATGDYNAAAQSLNTGSYYRGVGGYPGSYGTSRMLMVELKTGLSGGPSPGYYGPTLYEDSVMLRYQQPPDTYQEVFRPQGTHHGEISHCSFYCVTSLVTGNQSIWFANGNADQDLHMHHTILFNGSSLMRVPDGGIYVGDYNVFLAGIPGDSSPVHFHHYSAGWCVTLAAWQAATSQDAHSVYLDRADQYSGNPYAFWMGVREGINNGPEDGDWRVNPIARVYGGDNAARYGTFLDGTPIAQAGARTHWDWNARASVAGAPTRRPVVPASLSDARAYIKAPGNWRF